MYCPNCGKVTSVEQKFCRSCGLGLEKVALSLGEQLPARRDESLQLRKERLEKLGVGALSVFGLGVLGILVYAVAQKFVTTEVSLFAILAIIGLVIMFGCGLLSALLFAQAKELGEQANKRQLQPDTNSTSSTKELPEGTFEPVPPPVAERTTELLFVEKQGKK